MPTSGGTSEYLDPNHQLPPIKINMTDGSTKDNVNYCYFWRVPSP